MHVFIHGPKDGNDGQLAFCIILEFLVLHIQLVMLLSVSLLPQVNLVSLDAQSFLFRTATTTTRISLCTASKNSRCPDSKWMEMMG